MILFYYIALYLTSFSTIKNDRAPYIKFNLPDKFIDLDIIGNAIIMFIGGSEPIAAIISFCLYELALNKDIQNKLRAEIISTKEKYDGQFTHEFLIDLHYADMVLEGINISSTNF